MATFITSSATIELPMFDEHGGQIKDINGFLCFQKIDVPEMSLYNQMQRNPNCKQIQIPDMGKGAFYKWSPESIQLLLSLYVDSKDKFSSPVLRKATVWAEIAKQLNQHGYDVTVIQVTNKWKSLTNAYKRAKDHNGKSGNDRQTCPFFNELEGILGREPNICPVALSANRPLPSTSTAASATISLDQQVGIESIDSDSEAVVPVAKKAKLQKKMVDEPQWMREYRKEAAEREEAKERRHGEKMKAIQNCERLMNRLLEKL